MPQAIAGGSLLETHAQLGEMTRNLYGLLLIVEAGLFVLTEPALARLRGARTLPAGIARTGGYGSPLPSRWRSSC
ncbi:MAG: hypothetical protein U0Z44_20610 [Kouleothrix sp.]